MSQECKPSVKNKKGRVFRKLFSKKNTLSEPVAEKNNSASVHKPLNVTASDIHDHFVAKGGNSELHTSVASPSGSHQNIVTTGTVPGKVKPSAAPRKHKTDAATKTATSASTEDVLRMQTICNLFLVSERASCMEIKEPSDKLEPLVAIKKITEPLLVTSTSPEVCMLSSVLESASELQNPCVEINGISSKLKSLVATTETAEPSLDSSTTSEICKLYSASERVSLQESCIETKGFLSKLEPLVAITGITKPLFVISTTPETCKFSSVSEMVLELPEPSGKHEPPVAPTEITESLLVTSTTPETCKLSSASESHESCIAPKASCILEPVVATIEPRQPLLVKSGQENSTLFLAAGRDAGNLKPHIANPVPGLREPFVDPANGVILNEPDYVLQKLGNKPLKNIMCRHCEEIVTTVIKTRTTIMGLLTRILSWLIGSWCPLYHRNSSEDEKHICPNCGSLLGTFD